MSTSGWNKIAWMEGEPISLGQYERDSGQDTAVIQIYDDNNVTKIKIDRLQAK